jgi:hypothetical protein
MGDPRNNQDHFEQVIRVFEAEIANIGTHLAIDASARQLYTKQIHAMASELRAQATSGRISWLNAAEQAQQMRNLTMELIRSRSTPVGLAMAQRLKSEGKTLNELIARKVQQLYGKNAVFSKLTAAEQNAVYGEIVLSAGRSNPKVTAAMGRLSYLGKGMIVISVALSVYAVATAEDKVDTAERELVTTGAGMAGGVAGGALAGLACGPGAPVCVTVGAFVGGALAAFGVSLAW